MLSDVVAEQVVRVRKHLGVTREVLAERCYALGWPALTTGAIGSIETGRRDKETGTRKREVTVDEISVLARALNVPPLLLLTPIGFEDTVEVLPGKPVEALHAYRWWAGESILDGSSGPDQVVTTYKDYEREMFAWMGAEDDRARKRAWARLQALQKTMQSFGWRIPALPGEETSE